MSKSKKRNIIIGSLCAVVLLMAVGYAAFQTVLNIEGTSNITSSWDIKITNVTSKNIKGTASNNGDPVWENLSATFKTNLQAPGDSIEYDITVTNNGNLNAKLDKYKLTDANNEAIKFTQTGLTNGEVLTAGSTKTFTVKVEYLSIVSEQPSKVTSSLTITLDYSQAENGYTPGEQVASEQLTSNLVTSGDGLYEDTYEPGRYVYKGANPNNYITFNNEEWRIISVEADGTLKIIKNASIGNMSFDTTNSDNWTRPSTLNTYLNNDYYNALNSNAQNQIQSYDFSLGSVMDGNADLAGQIADEKKIKWTGKIGLISASDYLRANTNMEQCGNMYLDYNDYHTNGICKMTNYLFESDVSYWTISPSARDTNIMITVHSNGSFWGRFPNQIFAVYPVLYLKSDITLSGEGTKANPYIIK